MKRACVASCLCVALLAGLFSFKPPRAHSAEARGVAPALDKGGFTVDFWNAGAAIPPPAGASLLSNGGMEETDAGQPKGWEKANYVWLRTPDAARQARVLARVAPLMRWESSEETPHGGKRCMRLATPRTAYDPSETAEQEICAYYHQSCALRPLEDSAKYVLSYHHRGRTVPDVPHCGAYVRITFYDEKGKETRTYAQTIFVPTDQWRKGFLTFVAPQPTRRLDVRLALIGCGDVWFDDVALHPAPVQDKGPEVRLMPWYFLDNLYCLSSGDAGVMVFGFRNERGVKIERPQLVLQLPEGVDILDATAKVLDKRVAQTPDGGAVQEHRLDISAWRSRIHDGTFRYPFNMWEGLPLLLRTSRPAGDARLKAHYWLEDGAYRSTPLSFEIQVVPPIPKAAAPGMFKTGGVLFLVQGFRTEAGVKAFSDLYKRVGFNAVQVGVSPLCAEFGRLGIERYTQPLANGYTMGDSTPGKKPAEAVFRLADGQPLWEAICPVEVYRRGPYFRSAIENDILRKVLVTDRNAEQIMANWEPYMYNGKGCFCDRCKEEFKAFSKLPAAEVERTWPKTMVREHRDVWVKFRSWQHGKLMTTLEETVHALGKEAGLDSHFIPEIHWGLLTASWVKDESNREYAAVDYMDNLPVLEPWAPYNWYIFTDGPFDYIRGLHLRTHTSAREVREFVDGRLPEGKRPRLIAFPYGTYEGADQPEALAFEFLTYFLNGYDGAFAYLFPGGYDARYWRALGEANRLIAQFEPFVFEGRVAKRHELKLETPMPKSDPRVFVTGHSDNSEKWKDLPLVLSWEFERNGARPRDHARGRPELVEGRLIAVGNFWERGECFFRLTPKELDAAKKYVLSEPSANRVYGDWTGRIPLTGADLGKGILLHVGAMRYSFFILEPYREGADYGAIIRPQDMEAAMKERLGAIEAVCRDEESATGPAPERIPDYSALKAMQKDGLQCKPVAWEGIKTPCLRFQSAQQSLVVDPGTGGRVVSWKIGEFGAAHREDPFGLALDAFWQPALQVVKPYEVIEQEQTARGLKVVMRRVLANDGGPLAGLTLRKTIEALAEGIGFKVTTEITNTSETGSVEFAYRWHNMPSFLEQGKGRAGWARMERNGQAVIFTRGFMTKAYRRAPAADKGLDVVPTAPEDAITGNSVVFGCDRDPIQVRVDLRPQSLYSIVYWDEGGMPCATFEPVFARTVLKWGETWTSEAEWRSVP